ncbi:hypothetical protein ACJX0J_012987, partial [Zea mays]
EPLATCFQGGKHESTPNQLNCMVQIFAQDNEYNINMFGAQSLGGIQEVTGIAGNNLDDLPSKGNNDTFVDFRDNIISDNYKNALADLLEKEVEEEEDNGSGGMLLGVDLDVFDIGAIEEGDFFIKEMDITGIRSKEIISKLDEIDKRAESVPLSTSDGTKGRRKNRIFQMHNGDRMLYEDREYYKDLFGPPERLANGDWKTVETKFERNLCPTKRGARENRLFQITKNIGWQDGIKWLNVAIIKDLFMSKGTFQVKDGKNSTVAFVFSTGSMVSTSDFLCGNLQGNILDQDTFGLVIGGLGKLPS